MKKPGFAGSFWPSEQQELILRTVALPDDAARDAWGRLTSLMDLDRLEEGSFQLMPQLYRRLVGLGIDAPELPRLKGIYRRSWYANQLLLERGATLLRAFAERGIEPLIVGDAALAVRTYGDTGSREIAQMEIIVRSGDVAVAGELVGRAGWAIPAERLAGVVKRRGMVRIGGGAQRPLLVQTALLPEFSLTGLADETFGAATRGEIVGVPALFVDPADELVRVCALGARRTFWHSIVWAADAAALTGAWPVNWDRVVAVATANRAGLAVADALRYLTATLEIPVPSEVAEQLAAAPVEKKDLLAQRLAAGRAGSAGATLAPLIRTTDAGLGPALRRLPGFLRDRMSLERARDVPAALVRRKVAQVSARRKRARY